MNAHMPGSDSGTAAPSPGRRQRVRRAFLPSCIRHLGMGVVCSLLFAAVARGQSAATTRLLILQAEERRATTTADLSVIRVNARSGNPDTARVALRALGRLERVSLIPDILPGLRHSLPEVRIEAANALAQAAQGLKGAATTPTPGSSNVLGSTSAALVARLDVEADSGVRGALCEALARLPYRTDADAARAETAIAGVVGRGALLADRLGVAKALEAFVRLQTGVRAASSGSLSLLRLLAHADTDHPGLDLLRDARVRRLALEGLIMAQALDAPTIDHAAEDADPQVRRLAMRATAVSGLSPARAQDGLMDPIPMVRIEALRAIRARGGDAVCPAARQAATDVDMNAALIAIDQLAACGHLSDTVAYLERIVADVADLTIPRGWHRNVHALVALATAAPDRAALAMPRYVNSAAWRARAYAARAAVQMNDRATLEQLSRDVDARVANAALSALGRAPRTVTPATPAPLLPVSAAEVRRLASPRARVTIHDVGTFELALFTTEAPGTVIRFARLAESGYYNGLAFDRFAVNAIAQGGEKAGGAAVYPTREIGTWPHVRGSVGIAAPDTGDAQFFINLVDNPRFDHQYTVFGQILNGADVVDRILEGDVIESIVIVP